MATRAAAIEEDKTASESFLEGAVKVVKIPGGPDMTMTPMFSQTRLRKEGGRLIGHIEVAPSPADLRKFRDRENSFGRQPSPRGRRTFGRYNALNKTHEQVMGLSGAATYTPAQAPKSVIPSGPAATVLPFLRAPNQIASMLAGPGRRSSAAAQLRSLSVQQNVPLKDSVAVSSLRKPDISLYRKRLEALRVAHPVPNFG